MTETAPATFNVEDWLTDAALPEESATVYKRPDVVAELTELKRQIELEDRAASAESDGPTAGSKRYEAYLQTFSESALTVYVSALPREKVKAMRAEHEARTADLEAAQRNEEFGFDLLAAAIVAVKPAGGERTPAKFSTDQVKGMENAIGATQLQLILAARQQAQNGLPTVDADFLLKPSGTEPGQG